MDRDKIKELQASKVMSRLLANPDFKAFIKEVANIYNYENSMINQLTKDNLKESDVSELNYHIAQRNALGSLIISKQILEETVRESLSEVESPVDG